MTFTRSTRPITSHFTYEGKELSPTSKYTYLGIEINNRGLFKDGISALNHKALKAIFKIRSLTNQGYFPVQTHLKLFHSLVKPILTYNSDIWLMDLDQKRMLGMARASKKNKPYDLLDSIETTCFERTHTRFLKYTLGVYKSSSSNAARLEMGELPLEFFMKLQSVKNWHRIMSMDDTLVKESLLCAIKLHQNNTYSWATFIQNVLDSIGSNLKVHDPSPISKPFHLLNISSYLEKYYTQICLNSLSSPTGKKAGEGNKLHTYARVKKSCNFEDYLTWIPNFDKRHALTKLRISDHRLPIETGRYVGTPPDQRYCYFCPTIVGDEYHFIMKCPSFSSARVEITQSCTENLTDYTSLNSNAKFESILSARSQPVAKALANFCISGFNIVNQVRGSKGK